MSYLREVFFYCTFLLISASVLSADAKNVVNVIKMTPDRFSTFDKLLVAAGLEDSIEKGGPYTLFVPTNDAFKMVSNATIAKLMATPADLKKVILAHIVDGSYPLKTLSNNQNLKIKDGGSINITITNSMKMAGGANIVATDIMAENGVIHAIDQVLMPK